MTFQWITPPETLAKNIEDYGRRLLVAIQAAATYWGQQCQDDARRNAPRRFIWHQVEAAL